MDSTQTIAEVDNRLIRISDYAPHPRNYNRHPDEQIERIQRSLISFGQVRSIVVWGDFILAGHGVVEAAVANGWTEIRADVLPANYPEDLALAYVAADNELGRLADPDLAQLASILEDSRLSDPDLLLAIGYTDDEYDALLREIATAGAPAGAGTDTAPRYDQADELMEKWETEAGQIWRLGDHVLGCGDATDPDFVAAVLGDGLPQIMVTDPPYGVDYNPQWRAERGVNKNEKKMGLVQNDDQADWTDAWLLFTGDVAYVYHASWHTGIVQKTLESAGLQTRNQIIWAKDRMALGRGDYHWQHEPIWYMVRKGRPGHRNDDRTQTTIWSIPARDDDGHGHGTQKPIECMERPLRNHMLDIVYDPFCGSGTTLIACENLGKACFAIEINPAYVAVALERWAEHTGGEPEIINGR